MTKETRMTKHKLPKKFSRRGAETAEPCVPSALSAPPREHLLARGEIVRTLAQKIQEIESTLHRQDQCALSLGIPAFENLLDDQRVLAGSLMELLSAAEGSGAWTLAFFMAKHACEGGKALIVADSQRCFYPPAAA